MPSLNRFKEKTAVAIITCNREEFLHKALSSIDRDSVGEIFVVNAGAQLNNTPDDVNLIQCNRNPTVVGIAKNNALRAMKHAGYDYMFLMEDDVTVKDNKVFQKYIETAADSGLWAGQLSYALHGGVAGGNMSEDGTPIKRLSMQYSKHVVDFYKQSLHAFSLYHSKTIDHIGYMGENYQNAAEHLDHFYVAYMRGLGCNFWYFPDIEDSHEYLQDIDANHSNSVIRHNKDFRKNFSDSWGIFREKFGAYPHLIPDTMSGDVVKRLIFIEENYSRKDLLDIPSDLATVE